MSYRRNLLIVLAHGLRADVFDESACWPLRTAGLTTLAHRGMAVGATAASVADPGAMISLLTGLHPRQHGVVDQLPRDAPRPHLPQGWAASLVDAGYRLVGVGRVDLLRPWLHEATPVAPLEELDPRRCAYLAHANDRGLLDAVRGQRRRRSRAGPFDPLRFAVNPDDDVDGFIAAAALRRLEAMPDDRPWALVVGFTGPGNELPPPSLYDGLIDPANLTDGFVPADLTRADLLADFDYPHVTLQRLTPAAVGRIRADYLGRASLIDLAAARLVRALARRTDAARNWLVLGTDRGYLLGEHGLVGHRSCLTGSIEVPALVVPPDPVDVGYRDELVSTVDVAATIAALGGCDLPPSVAGRSLLPLLADPELTDDPDAATLCEYGRRLVLQTRRHKVVFDTDTREPIALFDTLLDVDEKQNLVDRPPGRNVLDALRWRLAEALLRLRAPAATAAVPST